MDDMTETHFQKELEELKENLLKMAALVEEAIRDSVQSLVKRDSDLAQKTFEGEDRINKMEITIDDMCLKLLALRQPMASRPSFHHLGDEDHHRSWNEWVIRQSILPSVPSL